MKHLIWLVYLFSLSVSAQGNEIQTLKLFEASLPEMYKDWFSVPVDLSLEKMTGREGYVLTREYQKQNKAIYITASLFDMFDEEGGVRGFYRRILSGKMRESEKRNLEKINSLNVYMVGGNESSKAYIAYENGVFAQYMGRNTPIRELRAFLRVHLSLNEK